MQYNKSQNQKLLKILIVGNSGVGKSCMLLRYIENNFTTAFYNTIGVDFQKMKNTQIDGRKIRMQWDTAGQDRFRTITSTYYKGAHGIIIVYDVTDRQSFDGLRYWLQQVDKYATENVDKLIVGNKTDQPEKRKVAYDEGYQFAKANKLEFTEVSAMNATNIALAFQMIARKVLKRLQNNNNPPIKMPTSTTKLNKNDSNSTGYCC